MPHFTCPIKWITGISCAGCGMTRAYISLLQGNVAAAFYYHPLFILPPIALAVWLLHKKLPEKFIKIFLIIIFVAFAVCYIIRLEDPTNTVVTANYKDSVLYFIYKEIKNVLFTLRS